MNGFTGHRGQCVPLPQYSAPPHYSGLTIPTRLIVDLHDTPLAIGLYSLIARQYVIAKAPIPLSTPDVLRYDPTLSRGAAIRAFARLISGGWIIETKRPGGKSSYTPSWGFVNNSPRPWQIGEPLLGRPRRQIVLRLNQRLLDTCIGKITPHPVRTALIDRYITTPLLGLADVGAYALCLAGHPTTTGPLTRLGLVRDGQAQAISSDQRILALASQRALVANDATMLTDRGFRRIGCVLALAGGEAEAQSQTLFFVPRHMIGSLIGPMIDSMIGQITNAEAAFTASGRSRDDRDRFLDRSHELKELHELQEETPPTPPVATGGGEQRQNNKGRSDERTPASKERAEPKRRARPAQVAPHEAGYASDLVAPNTEAMRALMAINVLPEQAAELSALPFVTIQSAIRDGQSRPGIRDLAGWVVHLLRNVRDHGWHIQPLAPRPDSPEALRAAFAQYAAEQEAACAHEEDVTGETMLTSNDEDADTMLGDAAKDTTVQMCVSDPEHPPAVALASLDLQHLWNTVLAAIQVQISRQEFSTWFRGVILRSIEDGIATLEAPGVVLKERLENRYLGLIRDLIGSHLGFPLQVRVTLHAAGIENACLYGLRTTIRAAGCAQNPVEHPGKSIVEHASCPAWISADRWEKLPKMLRAALIGSTLEDGAVRGKTDYLHRLLETRFAAAIAALQNPDRPLYLGDDDDQE